MNRSKARELFMQMLFQMEAQNDFSDEAGKAFLDQCEDPGKHRDYLEKSFAAFAAHKFDIDELLLKISDDWDPERMAKVDLAVLRVAITEMLYMDGDIPASVSINEAVSMAKKFSTEESGKFVNGMLRTVFRTCVENGKSDD